jgi:hypothetical protein
LAALPGASALVICWVAVVAMAVDRPTPVVREVAGLS